MNYIMLNYYYYFNRAGAIGQASQVNACPLFRGYPTIKSLGY